MKDIIFIEQLYIDTMVGIHRKERKHKQTVIVDLEIEVNFHKSIISDDINDTIDYESLVQHLTAFMNRQDFHLLETLASYTAEYLLTEFEIDKLKLRITKPKALSQTKVVGVEIVREKKDYKLRESF